ncbi:hypothetical protein WA026_019871 [Henosepilachna vigintioctopunctata]|uniref:Uncharacterized protein n=1 Tax=Henosepilachna vigintioctopunctata TaxID=420089 RepID=A0AAW1VCI3_9CUCU
MFTMRQANFVFLISIILICNREIWGVPIKNSDDVCQKLSNIKSDNNSVELYNVKNVKSWATILAECYRRRGRRRRYG